MSVPTTDAKLAEYSANFNDRGVAAPTDFGLVVAQMTQYTTYYDAWMSAYNACKAEGARNRALVIAKDDAKAPLLAYTRELYFLIKANPNVSNENKTLIGVTVSSNQPTPIPPPSQSPLVTIVSVVGRIVRVKLADRQFPNTRRRPLNAEGATILSYAGTTPPPAGDPSWKLEGQTGRNIFSVQFSNDIQPGTPCWIVAMWYNNRGDYSPSCEAVQTFLQIGPVSQAA